jgi:predicted PurR-regulated permease PerM
MTFSASPAARRSARVRWTVLADRLRTVRPETLGKAAIGLVLVALSVQLAIASWPALAPFVVGAVLAYAVLPIANRLDAVLPRWLAALVAELMALALLLGVAVVVVPPMLNGLSQVAGRLPSPDTVQGWVASFQTQVGTIPEPMRSIVTVLTQQVATDLRATTESFVQTIGAFVTSQILGLFGTVTNVLGLLVIPAWILTVVADERGIKQRAANMLPEAVRPDAAALFRIVDRALATFLRVRVVLAVVTGALVWAGLTIAGQLGAGPFNYAMVAGVLLGTLQLIPELGFYLGFVPLLIPLAVAGPADAGIVALVYIGAVKSASMLLEGRLSRGVFDVHPALLIPAIVVLSQFGLVWLFAAAPMITIVRDLTRYANARLSDPPGQAGVLPGEFVKTGKVGGRAAPPVPSAYQAPVQTTRPAGAPPAAARPAVAVAAASPVPRLPGASQRSPLS